MRIKVFALAFVAALVAPSAHAKETVQVAGWEITCDNSCVVEFDDNGGYSVRDSDGGRIQSKWVGENHDQNGPKG